MAREVTLGTIERKEKVRKVSSGGVEPNKLQEWVDSMGDMGSGIFVSTAMGVILIVGAFLIKMVFPGFLAG